MSRPRVNPEFVDKICPTCEIPFKISYRKKHQVYCCKPCAQRNPKTISKMKQSQSVTYMNKYGVSHPMKTVGVVNNFKAAMLKKYGKDAALKVEKFFEKSKKTKLEKYGIEHYNNSEKTKLTCLNRYGVDNVLKLKSIIDKTGEDRRVKHYQYLVEELGRRDIEFCCSFEDYKGYHFSNVYNFSCKTCSRSFIGTVYNLAVGCFCEYCQPDKVKSIERDMLNFLHSVIGKGEPIIRNDRTVLVGKELDFYIPSKKLAIEMNGLYWHSEFSGEKKKSYHLNKTKSCAFHGITLLHIFENEWNNKPEIVKSIIRNHVSSLTDKIHGRKCEIRDVSSTDKDVFLLTNHLQGKDKSSVRLGLFYENELVSIMTFRRGSRFEDGVEWELLRFCNKLNFSISGAASKLFQEFIRKHSPKLVVSYCDRRYFSGTVYEKIGFKFVNFCSPGYQYIVNNYKDLKHRIGFQKHKLKTVLKKYDPLLSEWENMKINGYDRIWDCGHSKWIYSQSSQTNALIVE